MNSFQAITRKEIGSLQDRMANIESLMEKIAKSVENSKINYYSIDHPREEPPQEVSKKVDNSLQILTSPHKDETIWNKILEYIAVIY